jgi:Oxidoreductase family, NAD-binding Rossmann fold
VSLVTDPAVDLVYVATPHLMHWDNAILALSAGKPVLVEKTFAMNAIEAIEVDGDFYAPAAVTLVPRDGEPTRVVSTHEGRGLRHQADQVARRLAAGGPREPTDAAG